MNSNLVEPMDLLVPLKDDKLIFNGASQVWDIGPVFTLCNDCSVWNTKALYKVLENNQYAILKPVFITQGETPKEGDFVITMNVVLIRDHVECIAFADVSFAIGDKGSYFKLSQLAKLFQKGNLCVFRRS